MMIIYTPQLVRLADVETGRLDEFAASGDVSLKRLHQTAFIAIPRRIIPILDSIDKYHVIKEFSDDDQLRCMLQDQLMKQVSCMVVPRLSIMRRYLDTRGFVSSMERVLKGLPRHQLIVSPGCYGREHVMGVGPVASGS